MKNVISKWLFVLATIGLWLAFSDSLPMPRSYRPYYYVFGWPFCFANASRIALPFTQFSLFFLLVDTLVVSAILALSWRFATDQRKSTVFFCVFATSASLAFVYFYLIDWSFPPDQVRTALEPGHLIRLQDSPILGEFGLVVLVFMASFQFQKDILKSNCIKFRFAEFHRIKID